MARGCSINLGDDIGLAKEIIAGFNDLLRAIVPYIISLIVLIIAHKNPTSVVGVKLGNEHESICAKYSYVRNERLNSMPLLKKCLFIRHTSA